MSGDPHRNTVADVEEPGVVVSMHRIGFQPHVIRRRLRDNVQTTGARLKSHHALAAAAPLLVKLQPH
ncbi:hypothetical protein FI667_g7056, partial [Globisporangium splendens]